MVSKLVLVLFIIERAFCGLCPGDPEIFVTRGDKTCKKIYNCPAGNEIVACSENCSPELCRPCSSSHVQPFLIHSTTAADNRRCFTPKGSCNNRDVIPVRNGISTVGCSSAGYCQCNINQCWYGQDPCTCSRYVDRCSKDEYLVSNGSSVQCVKCPQGFVTSTAGCGPCYKVSTTDTYSQQTTASSRLLKNGILPGINETTTPMKSATSTYQEKNLLYTVVGVLVAVLIIVVSCIICIICWKRRHLKDVLRPGNGIDIESTENHPLPETDTENTGKVSSSLIAQEHLCENIAYETLSSFVASETEQPGTFHPSDPRMLGRRGRPEGVSLEEDESLTPHSATVNEETSLLTNSSCPPKVDTIGTSEGISYIISKLNNCEVKQPVQCEEDMLTSQTLQKLAHSDVTHRKEVADQNVYSLTEEKLLCSGGNTMENTDPKYCTD